MEYPFTVTQKQRLVELDINKDIDGQTFGSKEERERAFREIQKKLVEKIDNGQRPDKNAQEARLFRHPPIPDSRLPLVIESRLRF